MVRGDRQTRREPRLAAFAPAVVLVVLGSLAAVAFLTALVSATLGVKVAVIPTGSMEPAVPAGSAALVRTTTADAVRVGDIVIVDRPGDVPLAHRVIGIDDPADAGGPTRDLTLRGDANPGPDPEPFRVDEVGVVLLTVPGGATIVDALRSPWVLGAVAVVAVGLVIAALRMRASPAVSDEEEPPSEAATLRRDVARRG